MKRKRSNDERTAQYVYSLPTPTVGSKTDAALDDETMEDGPVPMKHLKPTQKNPNGNDNFLQEHQADYDAHGKPTEQIRRVDTHNNACPKLIDELDKRRSIAKVTVVRRNIGATQTALKYDSRYKKRVKLRRAHKKSDSKFNRRTVKRKPRERRSRVTKYRKSQRKRMTNNLTMIKLKRNKSIQHFPHTMNAGTSPEKHFYVPPLLFNMAAEKTNPLGSFSGHDAAKESQNGKEPSAKESHISINSSRKTLKSQHSIRSKQYPDTSEPSVSSYNSYLSMDHEPMV